jgi:hypothetical protein
VVDKCYFDAVIVAFGGNGTSLPRPSVNRRSIGSGRHDSLILSFAIFGRQGSHIAQGSDSALTLSISVAAGGEPALSAPGKIRFSYGARVNAPAAYGG